MSFSDHFFMMRSKASATDPPASTILECWNQGFQDFMNVVTFFFFSCALELLNVLFDISIFAVHLNLIFYAEL